MARCDGNRKDWTRAGHRQYLGGDCCDGLITNLVPQELCRKQSLGLGLSTSRKLKVSVTDHRSNVTWMYAGYKDLLYRWKNGTQPKKGVTPNYWYAGKQYDEDVARAKYILKHIGRYYPGATDYQVAGFFGWHGNKDSKSTVYSKRYRLNLVRLIKQLRHDFQASHDKFVCASLGETRKGSVDNGGLILKAMQQVDGRSGRYPKFARHVASVYTYWLTRGNGNSGNHYNLNAETFMNVGEAMGREMVRLQRFNKNTESPKQAKAASAKMLL